jgi:putative endonuclease
MGYHHHDTGKKGEDMAAEFLQQQQFTILHRNWRHAHYEIDVIATRNKVLHFIEVKTRSSLLFGYPEDGVSRKKLQNLLNGAQAYMSKHPGWREVQYDILSITLLRNKSPEFFFIEDVMEY